MGPGGMSRFYIIGIDDNGGREFPPEVREIVSSHRVFSGGKRHYELVKGCLPEGAVWIDITVPLEGVFAQYEGCPEVVVFASGDPLFFGFANTVRKRLPEAEVRVFPWFNSLQLLAHRLVMPYHDMHVVSLTGRPWHDFDRALIEGREKIGVLTDRKHTPAVIAARMLEYGYDNYRMCTGEMLGNEAERVRRMDLEEAAKEGFAFPNCLILERTRVRHRPFGIPEGEFHLLDGRAKMITKMPIRLLTLSMLDLHDRRSFWDVGFCTGSVSIEAKLQFPHLQVTSFEVREEGRALMEANSHQFGVPGIVPVIGDFTEADLSAYPLPDAAFIGGHGGKLRRILEILEERLLPEGVVVCNAVTAETYSQLCAWAADFGFAVAGDTEIAIDAFHPIRVVKLVKNGKSGKS